MDARADDPRRFVRDVVHAVRAHLGMDVAFVSQFVGAERVFRVLEGEFVDCGLAEGTGTPLEDSFCARVLDGRLPQLMCDAQTVPEALAVAGAVELGIGAHISVPIVLSDGSVFGTLCCFSRRPEPGLAARDVDIMRAFADVIAGEIERHDGLWLVAEAMAERIHAMVETDAVPVHLQPIVRLTDARIVGAEALARFPEEDVPTLEWFRAAHILGLGAQLEACAVRSAARALNLLQPDVYLAFNLSTPALLAIDLEDLVGDLPADRLVLELTEHERVRDYDELKAGLAPLRARGVRLSVDDAGAGYATLTHVLELAPDIVKLDLTITRGIADHPARRAMAAALVEFGVSTGSEVIAEGIETGVDLDGVRSLGILYGQGYHLGRPVPPGVGWRALPVDIQH